MLPKLTTALAALVLSTSGALAAGGETEITDYAFPFEGPFGSYDQNQLQRGLKVYTEVCAACHGLKFVPIRTLTDEGGPGLSEAQVEVYAEQYEVYRLDEETGEYDYFQATPNDHFPANNSVNAPDLSLMTKARAGFHGPMNLGINQLVKGMGGAEYVASLLTHYEDPPACAPEDFDGYYNTAFGAGGYPEECRDENGYPTVPGSWIGMAPPLDDGWVEFDDGAPNDLESASQDVAAFLMWTAEPKLAARKQMGLTAIIMLGLLSVLLYLTNKRIWAPVKARKDD